MANDETILLDKRRDRLKKFILLSAPDPILGGACELFLRSLHRNSRLGLILGLTRELIGHTREYCVEWPIRRLLCRRFGIHSRDDTGKCYCCPIEIDEGEEDEC